MAASKTVEERRPLTPTERYVASRPYESIASAGEMGKIAVAGVAGVFSAPREWLPEAINLYSTYAKRMLIPMIVSVAGYIIGYAVFFFGGVTAAVGVGERFGGALYIGTIRELGVWITTMVFAGVAGSAVAADLGARKIREELDALSVLGVDLKKSLVVPRIVAMTVLAPTMGFIAIFIGNLCTQLVGPSLIDYPFDIGLYSILSNIYASDLIAFTIKLTIVGFFVAVISCQKGLSCQGGAEGVGRAVHQTVVLSFIGIWAINSIFNLAYLTLFPETAILKG